MERCTHADMDFNSLPPSLLPPSFLHSFHSPSLHSLHSPSLPLFHSPSLHLLTPPFPPSLLSLLQNLFCPDMLFTFDSLKDDLQTKIRHSMSPAAQASPPPDDPPVLSTSSAPSSPSYTQVSPIHLSVSEEDLERVQLLWSEECQEARWLLDLMELLNKLVPLRCAAVSDIERCKRGMEFCAGMTAVEEQLSLHAVSTGYCTCVCTHTSTHPPLPSCNICRLSSQRITLGTFARKSVK